MQISKKNNHFESWSQNFRGIKAALGSHRIIGSGLHTYPIVREDGSYKRLHLRIDQEGGGILFVDVTDVIHLNHTGVEIIRLALDGVSQRDAQSILRSKYKINDLFLKDIETGFQIVKHLLEDIDGCQTCALSGLLENVPLFSLHTGAPYKIDVALTYGCNNQCPHCYNEVNRLSMPSVPLEYWFRIFDRIAQLGIPHVILTGGEATLHPDFLEIVSYADQLGLIVGLNSNGRYLSHSQFMEEAANAGLNHVQITLGSCYPEIHNVMMGVNSFHQTIQGIKTAISSGVHVITNTTLMRSNMWHLDELVEFLYDLGIRTFAMNGMIYAGGGFAHPNAICAEELPGVIAKVRTLANEFGMRFLWYTPTEYCRLSPIALAVGAKKCNAGEYSICIEPNGDVLPCQSYYVSAGNILKDAWDQIWRSDLFISFRDREEFPVDYGLPEKCHQCPDLMVCGGGCRLEREAEAGIRIAEVAGGGCVGCSGYFNVSEGDNTEVATQLPFEETSFIPYASQVAQKRRSSGKMELISIEDIRINQTDD